MVDAINRTEYDTRTLSFSLSRWPFQWFRPTEGDEWENYRMDIE